MSQTGEPISDGQIRAQIDLITEQYLRSPEGQERIRQLVQEIMGTDLDAEVVRLQEQGLLR